MNASDREYYVASICNTSPAYALAAEALARKRQEAVELHKIGVRQDQNKPG